MVLGEGEVTPSKFSGYPAVLRIKSGPPTYLCSSYVSLTPAHILKENMELHVQRPGGVIN